MRIRAYILLPGLALALLATAGCPRDTDRQLTARERVAAPPAARPTDQNGPMRADTAGPVADRVAASLPTDSPEAQQFRGAIRSSVMDLLTSGNRDTRIEAARQLGDSRHKPAGEALLLATEETDPAVRAEALLAIGRLGDKAMAGPVAARLRDPSAQVRAAAARALGMLRQPTSAGPLEAALSDPSTNVRATAAWALGWLRLPGTVPALARALADREGPVRAAAAASLGLTGSPSAVAPLTSALADPNALVRYQTVNALGALGDASARAAIAGLASGDPDASVRTAARMALDRLAPAAP